MASVQETARRGCVERSVPRLPRDAAPPTDSRDVAGIPPGAPMRTTQRHRGANVPARKADVVRSPSRAAS